MPVRRADCAAVDGPPAQVLHVLLATAENPRKRGVWGETIRAEECGVILMKDLIAAEEAYLAAEREKRSFNNNPDAWSAYESVDREGRKHLNILPAQYGRQAALEAKVVEQRTALVALRQAFMEGR